MRSQGWSLSADQRRGKKKQEERFLFWHHGALMLADAHVYSAGGVCFFSGSALLAKANEEVVTKIIISLKQKDSLISCH